MKKIILTTLISFGLALAANADRKGDYKNDRHNSHSNKNSHYSNHNDHRGNDHRGYGNRGYNYGSHGSTTVIYTTQRVWVDGCSTRVWVEPRYEYVRQHCGTVVRVCVSHGYYKVVHQPGYYTYKRVPVYTNNGHCNDRSGLSISWRF